MAISFYGVLWDMDGVLVDTGEFHYLSWLDTLPVYGLNMSPESFKATFGMNNEGVLTTLLGYKPAPELLQEIADKKEENFRQNIRGKVSLLPGVRAWLEGLYRMGVHQAVASSAPVANVDAILEETGIRRYFQAFISAQGKPGKPDPWVFLEAARQIGAPKENCVVVEDAIPGVEAAHRAGMKCIAVTTTNPAAALQKADVVVERLDQLDIEVVFNLLTGH
jgi:beta-phosphoglucomutase